MPPTLLPSTPQRKATKQRSFTAAIAQQADKHKPDKPACEGVAVMTINGKPATARFTRR